jgi:FixJ family two-component response regulator
LAKGLVCIVDDDAAVRDSLRLLLERHGYTARCHPSAGAFLKAAQDDNWECFLFDDQMPELSGIELLEILRARCIGTPAIIMTTGATPKLAHRAARAGATLLHKPMTAGELLAAIREAAPMHQPRGDGAAAAGAIAAGHR